MPHWKRCLLAMAWSQWLLGGMWAQSSALIDVNSAWEFRETGTEKWLPATVPGSVHSDLLAAHLIPDPFVDLNEAAVQWVEERDWEYRTTISLTEDQLRHSHADLVFEGLDTYAELFLNGRWLGASDNMHRRWEYPAKQLLKVGDNELLIRFTSPMKRAMPVYEKLGYRLPSGNDAAAVKISPIVRKAAYHFGWDFAPRLVTAGIWRPVHLRLWSKARIKDFAVRTLHLSAMSAEMLAVFDLEVETSGTYGIELRTFPGWGKPPKGDLQGVFRRKLRAGKQHVEFKFHIVDPETWWPRGMGEPNRYDLQVKLTQGSTILEEQTQKFGIRTIELVREKDAMGTSFYFRINEGLPGGGPLYIKGANYVPADMLLPRAGDRQLQLLEDAAAVGMNMLRVWGGGVYADDAFYEWCDAHGMLVWQDLAFACMMYPFDYFQLNAHYEVEDNIRRLRQHPSLAIWCGNNEIDVAWHNWGWQKEFGYSEELARNLWNQYKVFFHSTFPNLLRDLDPGRPWIPTSPLSNWGKEENFNHHNMHYWGVWHGTDSLDGFSHYVPRFMSEYGFQSWPSPATMKRYTQPADWAMDSKVMLNRQKSYKGNAPILRFLRALYGEPKDFDAFILLSQLVQRDAMTLAIEAHRMKSPHCMGTLYWQLNDCWPGASWSTIDYDGVWKPAHHALKRLYAPQLVTTELRNDSLTVLASNNRRGACRARLRVTMRSFAGDSIPLLDREIMLHLSSNPYANVQVPILPDEWKRDAMLIETVLLGTEEVLSTDLHYFVPPKDLALAHADLKTNLTASGSSYTLELRPKTFVKDFYIASDLPLRYSDNFFDLLPGKVYRIQIEGAGGQNVASLKEKLHFGSLNELLGRD